MFWLKYVLLELAKTTRARDRSLLIDTSDFGKLLGVSQQTASRYLRELEEAGWIYRKRLGRKFIIRFTTDGISVIERDNGLLEDFLDSKSLKEFEGVVVSGIGEGAYYVGQYSNRISKLIGYTPFPGTLNVRLDGSNKSIISNGSISVDAFKSKNRSFGKVTLTPIILNLKGKSIDCHAIIPERTHHKRDLELIGKMNIREEVGVIDGDTAMIILK